MTLLTWVLGSSAYSHLEVGREYVCLDPATSQLSKLILREMTVVLDGSLPGACATLLGVLEHSDGGCVSLPTEAILWPASDHGDIVLATNALGIRLRPRMGSRRAFWRVDGRRVDVEAMAAYGESLRSKT